MREACSEKAGPFECTRKAGHSDGHYLQPSERVWMESLPRCSQCPHCNERRARARAATRTAAEFWGIKE